MLTIPLLPSFLDKYSLSMSFLGCKTLCIVFNFLVLWSICSSVVRLKDGLWGLLGSILRVVPIILKEDRSGFISLVWFQLQSLVSESFLIRLRYLFIIFSFISTYWWCPPRIFPSTFNFPFLPAFWFFRDLAILFFQFFKIFFPLLMMSKAHFYAKFHS